MLQQQAEAAENSGDARAAAGARALLKILETDPERAKSSIGLFLATAMGPKQFNDTFDTLRKYRGDVDLTTKQRDYEYYVKQQIAAGEPYLSFNEWDKQGRAAGATTVNNNIGDSKFGPIPPEHELIVDENGNARYKLVPGGPGERKTKDEALKRVNRAKALVAGFNNTMDNAYEALELTERGAAGFWAFARYSAYNRR